METLASFAKTQVVGGRQKMASKGKGKLKEKMTKPPSSDTFIKVPLNQILQTTNNVRKEKKATTLLILPTPPLGGV
jgi:hypothetical protein